MTVKTTFVNGVSPFEPPPIVLDTPLVADPKAKGTPGQSKYDYIFSRMERGQGIHCTESAMGYLGKALRHWLKVNGKHGRALQCKRQPGAEHTATPCRVWWV